MGEEIIVNEALAQAAKALNPLLAVVITLAGAIIGGSIINAKFGVVVGLLGGAAVAIALCGSVAMLAVMSDIPAVTAAARSLASAPAPQAITMASPAPTYAHGGHAMNGQPASSTLAPAIAIVESTVPAGAGLPPVAIEVTETEAQLLASGRFDAYHLAKAKRLFAVGNFKEAAYQAGASMSHVDSVEATELRKTALASAK